MAPPYARARYLKKRKEVIGGICARDCIGARCLGIALRSGDFESEFDAPESVRKLPVAGFQSFVTKWGHDCIEKWPFA